MQPETQSARSRRSYGKIEDCEQSNIERPFSCESPYTTVQLHVVSMALRAHR